MSAHLLVPTVIRLRHVMSHCGTLQSKGNQELLNNRTQTVCFKPCAIGQKWVFERDLLSHSSVGPESL